MLQFSVSVSKENSRTAEVLESISRSVRVKAENLRLAEVSLLQKYRDVGPAANSRGFVLSGGKEPLPAHVPALPFPGHGVFF